MAYDRFVAKLQSAAGGGPANPAEVDFDLDVTTSGVDTNTNVAQIIAYLVSMGQLTGVAQTITGVDWYQGGVSPVFPIAFPSSEFGTLAAANTDLASITAYGISFGGGSPLPRGTSICVSEKTAAPGRFGHGKHYLPFSKTVIVDGVGTLSSSVSADIQTYYDKYIRLGSITWAAQNLVPIVHSKMGGGAGTQFEVAIAQPASLFSMLQSRKR